MALSKAEIQKRHRDGLKTEVNKINQKLLQVLSRLDLVNARLSQIALALDNLYIAEEKDGMLQSQRDT